MILASLLAIASSVRQEKPQAVPNRPAPELTLASTASELAIKQGLVAGLLGAYGRSAIPSDLLAWRIAEGGFSAPREGDILGPDERNRTQTWARVERGRTASFRTARSAAAIFSPS